MGSHEAKSSTVLIIDDDQDLTALLKSRLKEPEFRVSVANTVRQFWSLFESLLPDLCIIDLNIEKLLDGLELIQRIRRNATVQPKILVLSGEKSEPVIAYAIEVGADDYLIKPPFKHHFIEKCTILLNRGDPSYSPLLHEVKGLDSFCRVAFHLELEAIDATGVKLRSASLLPKGTVLKLYGTALDDIIESDQGILVTVMANWALPEHGELGAYAEFDPTNQKALAAVRKWLLAKGVCSDL